MKVLEPFTNLDHPAETALFFLVRLSRPQKIALGLTALAMLTAVLLAVPQVTYLLIAVGIGVPAAWLLWQRPELGLIGIIFLSSGFLHPDMTEVSGGLELRDLAFLGMLGFVGFRGLVKKSLFVPWWPVGAPLLLFLALALFSLVNALVFEGVETNWAFNDMRILLYYGMFFLTAWSIRKPDQFGVVLLGLFVIADMIAVGIIAQQFLGTSRLFYPGMDSGRSLLIDQGGIIRVIPAAHALLHFMAVMAVALLIFTRKSHLFRAVYALQLLLLGTSSLLTLTRSQWLATGIAVLIMALALAPRFHREMLRFTLRVGLPAILLLIGAFGFFGAALQTQLAKIPVVSSIIERADTLTSPDDTLATKSLEWRQFEFEEAMRSIRERPLLGVSLGNSYRNVTTLQGEAQGWWTDGSIAAGTVSRFTRYIHNSYLAIAVKMGLLGAAVFMWFITAFIVKSWQLYRRLPFGVVQGMVLAIFASFIGLLQWSIFMTHFIRSESTIAIGIMAGLVAAVVHMQARGELTGAVNKRW